MKDSISSEELKRLANNLDDEMKRFDSKCRTVASRLNRLADDYFNNEDFHKNGDLFLHDNPHLINSEEVLIGDQLNKYSESFMKARELVNAKFGFIRDKMRHYVESSTTAQSEASKDLESITATLDSTQNKFN